MKAELCLAVVDHLVHGAVNKEKSTTIFYLTDGNRRMNTFRQTVYHAMVIKTC